MNIIIKLHNALLDLHSVLSEILAALEDEDASPESLQTLYRSKQNIIDKLDHIQKIFPEDLEEISDEKVDNIRDLYSQVQEMDARALKKIDAGVKAFSTNMRKVENELEARELYATDDISDNSLFIKRKLEG